MVGCDNSYPRQLVNFQYIITIMSGREVSRPYHNIIFMFLFLIPFTTRQHCIIYPQECSTEPGGGRGWR